MGHAVLTGAGVRWYAKWEQIAQLQADDIEKYFEMVVKPCAKKDWSGVSMKKILALLSEEVEMAFCLVEATATTIGGRAFCQGIISHGRCRHFCIITNAQVEETDLAAHG